MIARIVFGGLCGAGIALAGSQLLSVGAIVGIAGALIGTFAGHEVRLRSVRTLGLPDFVVAILEDIVAIGGGLFIVSRS